MHALFPQAGLPQASLGRLLGACPSAAGVLSIAGVILAPT